MEEAIWIEELARREAAKPLPKDMSHHFSDVTKARMPNKMKEFYKYFQIPGIGQLAGGESQLTLAHVCVLCAVKLTKAQMSRFATCELLPL
jgi:hypothetical protein